jgi:hypothetical protein
VRVAESEQAFRAFLESRNVRADGINVTDAINAWVDFYKAQRLDDVVVGMDWLWFQYGTYDWGTGPSFQLDLTRQFILEGETEDDAIWQMHLVLHFPPETALESGIETCEDPEDASADMFRDELLASTLLTRVRALTPDRVELYLENAG